MRVHALDIRGLICPMTWVRVRCALDELTPGERLRVVLDHRPALSSIRTNAEDLGHEVLQSGPCAEGTWEILLEAG